MRTVSSTFYALVDRAFARSIDLTLSKMTILDFPR